MRLEYSAVSVRRLLSDVRHIFDLRATEQGISLEVSVDSKMPAAMMLDETRLRQVLFNLVGNAIKFTHEGGVTVRATATPRKSSEKQPVEEVASEADRRCFYRLVVTVSDTGIGIPEEDLPRLGRPFEQIEAHHSRKHEGSGLGLALSKSLVELHGGTLRIDSTLGKGTTVSFTLPAQLPDEASGEHGAFHLNANAAE